MCDFIDYLEEAGISDSRRWSLRSALDSMHSAYCELDLNNRQKFDEAFGSGVREALIAYAQRRPALDAKLRTHVPQEELIRQMSPSNRIIDLGTDRYVEED
jgi:hypothetical protein